MENLAGIYAHYTYAYGEEEVNGKRESRTLPQRLSLFRFARSLNESYRNL